MSDKEKKEILDQHKSATKAANDLRASEKGGIQTPEKKEEKKD